MFQFATTDEEASALWEARKYALWSVIASEEGSRAWTTDVWFVFFCFAQLLLLSASNCLLILRTFC